MISEDDCICPICLQLLHEPVSLRCSHTLCRSCLRHLLASRGSSLCPLCRAELDGSRAHRPNHLLARFIAARFPEAAKIAAAEHAHRPEPSDDPAPRRRWMPLDIVPRLHPTRLVLGMTAVVWCTANFMLTDHHTAHPKPVKQFVQESAVRMALLMSWLLPEPLRERGWDQEGVLYDIWKQTEIHIMGDSSPTQSSNQPEIWLRSMLDDHKLLHVYQKLQLLWDRIKHAASGEILPGILMGILAILIVGFLVIVGLPLLVSAVCLFWSLVATLGAVGIVAFFSIFSTIIFVLLLAHTAFSVTTFVGCLPLGVAVFCGIAKAIHVYL